MYKTLRIVDSLDVNTLCGSVLPQMFACFVRCGLPAQLPTCALMSTTRCFRMDPSKSCGPYRLEDNMYDVIPAMIDTLPGFFRGILKFVTSAAFATAVFVCLV